MYVTDGLLVCFSVPAPGMYPAQQAPPQVPQGPQFTEEDLKQVKDMFPNMEEEVIASVFAANNGNKDATINSLLQMSADWTVYTSWGFLCSKVVILICFKLQFSFI